MNLTLSQIREFTFGALTVAEHEDGLHFARYTQTQIEAFRSHDEILVSRAKSTCGVRIDFHTDSKNLTVCVGRAGKYEVLVDDLTAYAQQLDRPCSFTVPLGAGTKRVTIILPSHAPGVIQSIELDDKATATAHRYSKKLAFYGDSITQGWECEKDSQSFAWLTSRFYDADSMILGVGRAQFYPNTLEDVGFEADAVIVALGTNDFSDNHSMDRIRSDCAEYLSRLSLIYPGKPIFCITPIWRADEAIAKAGGLIEDAREVIREEAEKHNAIVIDGLAMVPHRCEYFADAVIHPNDLGFALYAQNLIKTLSNHL